MCVHTAERFVTTPRASRDTATGWPFRSSTFPDPRGTARMTFGFLAARLLLDWYRGDRSADHALFAFSR